VTDLVTALEMYDSSVDMRQMALTYGVEPTSLTTWLRQRSAPAS